MDVNGVYMPIYVYRCTQCGLEKEVLQKISDAPLSSCPACHAAAFSKQVTAAGFQLKGSGWYVTDFKDNKPKTTSQSSAEKTANNESATSSTDSSSSTTDKASIG